MKKFFQEFKTFAMRGNVLDMAIGVVVGAAFKAIVDSLVNDIISPVIGLFFATDFSAVVLTVRGVDIGIGSFLNAVINFLIAASALYKKKPEPPKVPTTKICPYCQTEIPIKATRCPHCTSELETES